MSDLASLTAETFEALEDKRFALHVSDAEVIGLELAAVRRHAANRLEANAKREPFSLIFVAPDSSHVPQHTYRLANADLGDLTIFLVPIGPVDGQMRYQAVFN